MAMTEYKHCSAELEKLCQEYTCKSRQSLFVIARNSSPGLQIMSGLKDNSKINVLISPGKHTL